MMTSGMYTSNTAEWATPRAFFEALDKEFHFTLDPCATAENAKCAKFYTKETDGLAQSWRGERVFCNPPYGREIGKWVKKAHEETVGGGWTLWRFYCPRGRIRAIFMSTYTIVMKCGLSAGGCISTRAPRAHRFRLWSSSCAPKI